MKTLLLISTLILSVSLSSNELLWVDEQVEAIKPPRKGMDIKSLNGLKDPFVFLIKEEKKTPLANNSTVTTPTTTVKKHPKPLRLSLVLNNSAMINDIWYKKGDKLGSYTVSKISQKSVLLTKKNKQLLLSTKSSTKNLKFNNK